MTRTTIEANAALLEQLRRSSRDGFDAIFVAHGRTVLRFAWRLADSPSDAEELAQETFLTLWSKRRSVLAQEVALLPWLLATCRKHAANLHRRNLKHRVDVLDPERADRSGAQVEAAEQLAWVEREIAAMPSPDREIARLCLIEGVPYTDAARELGLGYAALAKRVERTRARLRSIRNHPEGEQQ
jgi:RNA polymerase sigma factor (sigma-70 family)